MWHNKRKFDFKSSKIVFNDVDLKISINTSNMNNVMVILKWNDEIKPQTPQVSFLLIVLLHVTSELITTVLG